MNKVNWTKWSAIAEILSAIAIVVTLLYLALQTRYLAEQTELSTVQTEQNNSLLQAEAGRSLAVNRASYFREIQNSPELAALFVKIGSDQALSPADRLRVIAGHHASLINWEWEYGEYLAGRLAREQLPVQAWKAAARGESPVGPGSFADYWQELKPLYSEEFVQFIESEIIPND